MNSRRAQCGQALVEGLLAMLVLVSIWVAVAWLGNLQDMALTVQHASRHAAFSYTRNPSPESSVSLRGQYFMGPAHQWNERSGKAMLPWPRDQVRIDVSRSAVLGQPAQAGGTNPLAHVLRNDWGLLDKGIVHAQVLALPKADTVHHPDLSTSRASILGLKDFSIYPQLRRHISILEGAGHASGDVHAQQIIGRSLLAWSDSAHASGAIGLRVDATMSAVDKAWDRQHPVFDWLQPWAGYVPAERLEHSFRELP
ncbi:hypothetical protein LKR43_03575 [Pusillimonas sp. MFBS29]|uniref:hypothetical protein n=1 Tax=Pusillimonas sp. MFBS29 TaxID=2886690 RepID=UPI001D109C02|nr:hypothetical protein [Pusillimonas sp. MFBS29]MCC2595413.1 hypothetical protein [Pusillimonas sp. MFBS29]